jgi:glycine/D-amino acid oxidase-like deaminating enzyme
MDATVTDSTAAYRSLSLWHDTADDDWVPRAPLPGDRQVDVAIVGAGFTGLWTAFYLSLRDPSLRIAVLEKEVAGFGASGRNGGWSSALFPASLAWLARRYGRDAAIAQHRAMHDAVDEIGNVVAAEGIDCSWHKGGTVSVARTSVQLERARDEVAEAATWGFGPEDVRLLDPREAGERLAATSVLGGTFTPHCAVIHPARLVRGLAKVVEARGVAIYEQTPVTELASGVARTTHGSVRADVVVRATEGYTSMLPGHRRDVAPIYSLMLATEPLSEDFWGRTGLANRETWNDLRHLVIYGQRTADGRLAFGGRGAPYHFGSRVRPEFDREPRVFEELRRILDELFPDLAEAAITHTWGGPVGIARDWCASVGLDRPSGLAWAGGYVGDGVTTTNLAGRTLADLITGEDSDLTRLPWVNHRSRRWEPEPLRWLGVTASVRIGSAADAEELRTGRPSRRAALLSRLTGH